jgi:hypothetical protein
MLSAKRLRCGIQAHPLANTVPQENREPLAAHTFTPATQSCSSSCDTLIFHGAPV